MPTAQFKREADMLAPIAKQAAQLMPGSSNTFFEVQTTSGVPDIVFCDFNKSAVKRRKASGKSFITDLSDMCVTLALKNVDTETVTAPALAERLPWSAKYISSTVLPRLAEHGHVERERRGHWRLVSKFESLARRTCTIEVKIRDWRSGYGQALRHGTSADEAWLVLDCAFGGPASAHEEWFQRAGVGLATLHATEGINRVVAPKARKRAQSVYRELLAERAANLYVEGKVSDSIGLVFGADLTTSTGPDPRRPSGGVLHSGRGAAR
ncbi:hypothetical protein Sfulv_31840 [Streptomyces fulvorobeus]|uniref:Uncharacterized protein n=1 Tax=Streptomyces fulvorobeus TaxID=284028 RepID=A0A7J0C8Z4_9ACTN|nr:hypothetical protein [Streptomyces fulvorobeus]GFM98373.1 hypothetical protein Sfulv_31840 [Streptomyces fulvorobeus]